MSSSESLNELELRVFRESLSKSIEEIAESLGISQKEATNLLESARRKMPSYEVLESYSETELLPRPIFKLEERIGEPQIGAMKVGSKILETLSKGIYSQPWNSLKELISNSYDADAPEVHIEYSRNEKKLTVSDTGTGMDYKDFDEHFTFIVKSEKRKFGDYTPIFRRPLIGKIGIGFIAVSELCDQIRVTSAKRGAATYFVADIDFAKIRSKEVAEKEFHEVSQYTLTNYEKEDLEEHYTRIELLNLKDSFIDILENKSAPDENFKKINSTSFEKLISDIFENSISDIRGELGPYWEFLVNFASVVPIEYLDDGPIAFEENEHVDLSRLNDSDELRRGFKEALSIVENLKSRMKSYNFRVYFNGIWLKKPFRFPHQREAKTYGTDMILVPMKQEIECVDPTTNEKSTVGLSGFFYNQRTRILPKEFRGMIVRIKNVAIGGLDKDFHGHPSPGDSMYFPQTFGEVYVEEGLEEAMNIDRSSFKRTHFEFSGFENYLYGFLRKEVFQKAKNLWSVRRGTKGKIESEKREQARMEMIGSEIGSDYKLVEVRKFDDRPAGIQRDNKSIVLNPIADQFEGFKKPDRLLMQDVALAIEISLERIKTKEDIKKKFWETLRKLTSYRR